MVGDDIESGRRGAVRAGLDAILDANRRVPRRSRARIRHPTNPHRRLNRRRPRYSAAESPKVLVRSESQDRRRPGRCSVCGSGRLAVVGQRAAPLALRSGSRRAFASFLEFKWKPLARCGPRVTVEAMRGRPRRSGSAGRRDRRWRVATRCRASLFVPKLAKLALDDPLNRLDACSISSACG